MSKQVAILGLGWLGEALAVSLKAKGFSIAGSTNCTSRLRQLIHHPFYVGKIELTPTQITGDWSTFINEAAYLIINIPPKRIDDIEEVFPLQIQQLIKKTDKDIKVIFVSSTAVYGTSKHPLSESATTPPNKASGKALIAAENLLRSYFGNKVTILRLAGMIGPERNPRNLLTAQRVLKNPDVPVNLIHRDDCIALIKAIIEQDCFGEIINGCASKHPLRKTYYKKAAELLQLDQPKFDHSKAPTPYKIIDNSKSKSLLGYNYKFDNPEEIYSSDNTTKIRIIGAGPGNKNLLTLQAFDFIEQAEVILYDSLVSEVILAINPTATKVYVGRKYGEEVNQLSRQEHINQLMVEYYQKSKAVVRLKAGDPYIYGRAAEEAHYLTNKKIPFEVIPGISSAFAAANRHNIPITERNKSNAVLICTAHTADYSFDQLQGIAAMLKAGNTLALYMGMKSLDKLIPKLIEVCQDLTIPISAVSNVSRDNEYLLKSTLGNLLTDIETNPIAMPVVFIIGAKPIQA